MRQRMVRALGLLLIAAVVLAAAACGGGKKAAVTTTPATTTAATEQTTTTAKTTSSLGGIASAANCKQLADLGSKFSQAMSGTDAQDTKKVAQLLQDFASKTPSDIRPDFQVLADAYSKIADAMGNVKPGSVPDPTVLAKLAKLSGEIDSAKLTTASEHISAWVQKSCHP